MLTIEYCDVEENVMIGTLFEELGFLQSTQQTDQIDDSFVSNKWPIEVLSFDAYYPIDGFRWTKLERQVQLFLCDVNTFAVTSHKPLTCSPEHLVLRLNEGDSQWIKVGDLRVGDVIIARQGLSSASTASVRAIERIDELERLCDLQVSIAHSYFADGVLSHNSHFLTMLGANALRNQTDVLHYTMELSEAAIGRRYDSNLCDIDSSDVFEHKDEIIKKYNDMQLGRLIIKEFPTNSATIYTLRAHIERLELKGFRPGVIIIDYADIMRSTRQYDSLRHELKLIYEELRGFAVEKGVAIWSASQSNKEGSNADVIDLGNMSEAYGKAMIADTILSISRKSAEKAHGTGRLFVAKNRAGKDGILYPIKIDTARSKFEIVGSPGDIEEVQKNDEETLKKALRQRWSELKPEFENKS